MGTKEIDLVNIKLERRLKNLEYIKKQRELTAVELDAIACCKDILACISSMPDSFEKIWHDARKEKPQGKEKIMAINEYSACDYDYAINMAVYWPMVTEWAYVSDILKLARPENK